MHGQAVASLGLFPSTHFIPVLCIGKGAGDILDEPDAYIHFHDGKSLIHTALHPQGEGLRIIYRGCIHIDPHPVAIFSSQQLVERNLIDLPGKIPQGHLHPRYSASLAAMIPELLNDLKDPFHVAGILPEDPAL